MSLSSSGYLVGFRGLEARDIQPYTEDTCIDHQDFFHRLTSDFKACSISPCVASLPSVPLAMSFGS